MSACEGGRGKGKRRPRKPSEAGLRGGVYGGFHAIGRKGGGKRPENGIRVCRRRASLSRCTHFLQRREKEVTGGLSLGPPHIKLCLKSVVLSPEGLTPSTR